MSIQQSGRAPLLDNRDEEAAVAEPEPTVAAVPEQAAAAPEAEPEPPEAVKFTLRSETWAMFMLGWPMVISFVCRIAMASTDTAFVGHLTNETIGTFFDRTYTGEEYLAAASLSDMVVNILIVPPLAFNQVLNALVGQALGSGNKLMAGTWLQLSMFFLSISYVPMLLLQYFFVADALRLLGFSADVAELAGYYAKWNLFWPIPNGIYQCLRFYFQAQGMPRPAMWNNLAYVLVNGLLNWIFVFGGPFQYEPIGWHGFGFVGAAMSISTSRCLQPLTYWLYMFVYKKAHRETWPGLSWAFLQRERVRAFLTQARAAPSLLHSMPLPPAPPPPPPPPAPFSLVPRAVAAAHRDPHLPERLRPGPPTPPLTSSRCPLPRPRPRPRLRGVESLPPYCG